MRNRYRQKELNPDQVTINPFMVSSAGWIEANRLTIEGA
jgi:hypothetical protein